MIDGSRTPFLRARGAPGPFSAADLAVAGGRPLLARQPLAPDAVDEVITGCVIPAPDEANISRIISLRLGCGEKTPAWTVQRNCASGMQSVVSGVDAVSSGRAEIVLSGGVEAMSRASLLFSQAMVIWLSRWRSAGMAGRLKLLTRLRGAHFAPVIALLRGLTDPVVNLSMGQTAENLAWQFGIDRKTMDAFAVRSHRRLARAREENLFGNEIEPLYGTDGTVYEQDDGVRPGTDLEQLAALKPAFDRPFGQVTAGNSAQVTDGAAWLLLAGEEAVERHGLTPLGRVVDTCWAGVDPARMGLGPAHAVPPLLRRNELDMADVDYWEINEAFAAQVLACLEAWNDEDYCRREFGWDGALGQPEQEHLNVDGGAISLGHPLGASGTRIILHLLHVLGRERARRGIASLCVGGGQGGAVLVEREQ